MAVIPATVITVVAPFHQNVLFLTYLLSSDFLLLPVLEDACPPRALTHKGSTLVKPGNKSVSSKYEVDNINFSILVQTIGIILFLTIALAPHKRPYHRCHFKDCPKNFL